MPTFELLPEFRREFKRLTPEQQALFRSAVRAWVRDIRAHGLQPTDPRVSGIKGAPGVFEFRWAPNGRATFEFGPPKRSNEPHVIWRRIGTHDILRHP